MSHHNDANGGPLEKDFSDGAYHLDNTMDHGAALNRIRTAGSVSLSPELFEKLYLSPQNNVAGDLRKMFGNPTPIALVGFLLSLTPLSCILMGWRGAGGSGASDVPAYMFFGGLLMIVGATGEWFLGNTFPCVVFFSFGAFWLTFGGTLTPFYNAIDAFTAGNVAGASSLEFNASFGFFQLWMGFLCFIYLICSLRTNLVFVGIFGTLVPAFGCLAGVYWHLAEAASGNAASAAVAGKLLVAAGAITFVTDMLGWYIFAAILLASVDFPFSLPVGDLSTIITGANDRRKKKEAKEQYSA